METINITIHTNNDSHIEAIKAFMEALKIKFEFSRNKSPYNPEFVKKIKQGDEDLQNGKGKEITLDELDNLWK